MISEGYVYRLDLKPDDFVEFCVLTASSSSQKKHVIFYLLKIDFGNSSSSLPIFVMEGLHFNFLLGMSWLKAVTAIVDPAAGKIPVRNEISPSRNYLNRLRSWSML